MNSQKSHSISIFGSDGFSGEGSTRAADVLPLGPGLRRKVSRASTENQILPPAMRGIVAGVVEPGGPRLIAQSVPKGAPVEEGEVG